MPLRALFLVQITGGGRDKAPAHGYYTDMLCFVERVLMYLIFSGQSSYMYIILFRSVPLSLVTHTGFYKQRNGTEQARLYIEIMQSTEK